MAKNSTNLKTEIPNNFGHKENLFLNIENPRFNPSDAVIRNILNYSKALSVLSDKLTGNISLILLN